MLFTKLLYLIIDKIDAPVAPEKKFHWTIPISIYKGKSFIDFIQSEKIVYKTQKKSNGYNKVHRNPKIVPWSLSLKSEKASSQIIKKYFCPKDYLINDLCSSEPPVLIKLYSSAIFLILFLELNLIIPLNLS